MISVHWDRLDVKVAVRYPKNYGPVSKTDDEDEVRLWVVPGDVRCGLYY